MQLHHLRIKTGNQVTVVSPVFLNASPLAQQPQRQVKNNHVSITRPEKVQTPATDPAALPNQVKHLQSFKYLNKYAELLFLLWKAGVQH